MRVHLMLFVTFLTLTTTVRTTLISNLDLVFETFNPISMVRFFEFNDKGWNISTGCIQDMFLYLDGLHKDVYWALKRKPNIIIKSYFAKTTTYLRSKWFSSTVYQFMYLVFFLIVFLKVQQMCIVHASNYDIFFYTIRVQCKCGSIITTAPICFISNINCV